MIDIASTISKITTMHDGALRLQVDTQAIGPELKAHVMEFHDVFGHFVFAAEKEPIHDEDLLKLPVLKMPEEEKSPATRLRGVLFRLWQKKDGGKVKTSEGFYRDYMERVINKLKEDLN